MNKKRSTLRAIAGASILSTASSITWTKPIVSAVLLPAHAQTSEPTVVVTTLPPPELNIPDIITGDNVGGFVDSSTVNTPESRVVCMVPNLDLCDYSELDFSQYASNLDSSCRFSFLNDFPGMTIDSVTGEVSGRFDAFAVEGPAEVFSSFTVTLACNSGTVSDTFSWSFYDQVTF